MTSNGINQYLKTTQNQIVIGKSSPSINQPQNTLNNTSSVSYTPNGNAVYASMSPLNIPYQKPLNGNHSTIQPNVLHQIIANDVRLQNHRNKIAVEQSESKNTVVRKVPDGAVQITYRKMVNTVHTKSNNLPYILPKPCRNINPVSVNGQYITSTPLSLQNGHVLSGYQHLSNGLLVCTAPVNIPTTHSGSSTTSNLSINLPKMNSSNAITSLICGDPQEKGMSQGVDSKNLEQCQFPTDHQILLSSSTSTNNSTYTPILQSPIKDNTTVTSSPCHTADPCSTGFTNELKTQQHDLDSLLNPDFNRLDNMEIDGLPSDNSTQNTTTLYDNDDLFRDLMQDNNLVNSSNSLSTNCMINTSSNFSMSSPTLDPLSISTEGFSAFIESYTEQTNLLADRLTSDLPRCGRSDVSLPQTYEPSLTSHSEDSPMNILNIPGSELIDIIDVSPEISTTSGGNKIILIGSWNAKEARYTCKFGEDIVDAVLIQNGVLRCYSPAQRAGKIRLSVLCNGVSISKQVDFEFVDPSVDVEDETDDVITHDQWMEISNESLLQMLEERISAIIEIMGMSNILVNVPTDVSNMEEKFVLLCKQLVEVQIDFHFDYQVEKTMTLLHLSAALGYIKLIQLLLNWVETNPHKLIQAEACPTRHDQFYLLPIMWSAAKGHFNTTCVLHQWDENTLAVKDTCSCTVIDLAKEFGHTSLVSYLDRILKKSASNKESLSSSSVDTNLNSPHGGPSSVTSQMSSDYGDGSRTLGKTLAHIQSIISEEHDDDDSLDICSDGEESIFEKSPFTPRRSDESRVPAVTSHSQISPSSPSQNSTLQSPFNRQMCETAEFCEFFFKAKTIEKDFAELTLTDEEQEDLYKAANVIQTAYKSYKDRRKQRDVEFSSAVLIQSYYRRYKQYAAFKKMQKGAVLIQNQYRAHREKAARKKTYAAQVIQTYYRRYRERKGSESNQHTSAGIQMKNRTLQQAERKNNRFLQQSTKRFSREFADSFMNPDYAVTPTTLT